MSKNAQKLIFDGKYFKMTINLKDWKGEKIVIFNTEKVEFYQSATIELKIDIPELSFINGIKKGKFYMLDFRAVFLNEKKDFVNSIDFNYYDIELCEFEKTKEGSYVHLQANMTQILGVPQYGFILDLKIFLKTEKHNKKLSDFFKDQCKKYWIEAMYLRKQTPCVQKYTKNIFLATSLLNKNIKFKKKKLFFKSCLLDEEPKVHNVLVFDWPRDRKSLNPAKEISYKYAEPFFVTRNNESSALNEHLKFKLKSFQDFFVDCKEELLKSMIEYFFKTKLNEA